MSEKELKMKSAVVISILETISNCIKGCKSGCPSGVLYSQLLPFGINLQQYENIITAFKDAGKVKQIGNVLYWHD